MQILYRLIFYVTTESTETAPIFPISIAISLVL